MKYFTFLLLFLVMIGCAPPAVNMPEPANAHDGVQRFVDECMEGFHEGGTIEYRVLEGVDPDSCATYTLVNFTEAERVTVRVFGQGVQLNAECVMIGSIDTVAGELEGRRCVFDDSLAVLNIYLLGENLRVVSEVQTDSRTLFLPPIGVESEKSP